MAGLVISYPIISVLWIGHVQTDFIAYGWILGIGWLVATLSMPTYYYCLSAGRVRAIVMSYTVTVGLHALLGLSAAILGHSHWVATSMMISLALGNLVTTQRALEDLKVNVVQTIQTRIARNVVKTLAMIIAMLTFNVSISITTSSESYVYTNFASGALLLLLIFYLSDARKILLVKYQQSK